VLNPQTSLKDTLEILVVTGIVQISAENNNKYTMLSGMPRAHAIFPNQVLEQLQSSQQQEERTLMGDKVVAREELKSILCKYPEVVQDPVYVSALRDLHVDVAAVERDRFKQNVSNKKLKTSSSSKPSSSKSAALANNGTNRATTKEGSSECKKQEIDSGNGDKVATTITTTKEDKSESKEPKTDTGDSSVVWQSPLRFQLTL